MPIEHTPIESFKRIMQNYAHVSSKWSGLTGADHIASLGERERLLMEANCFVFNGTERLLSYFNSSKISSLNLNGKIAFFSKPLEHIMFWGLSKSNEYKTIFIKVIFTSILNLCLSTFQDLQLRLRIFLKAIKCFNIF